MIIGLNRIFEVEIDVDGVLADMDGSYGEYVKDIIPDFSEEKYIKEWNMPEIARDFPEAHKRIVSLYSTPEFMRNLPRYSGIIEGLQRLYALITPLNGVIVIHTHVKDYTCSLMRREWLEELRAESGVNFEIDISNGDLKNMRKGSLILIEDNVRNCRVSDAKYKFLVRRGHNRAYNECDLGGCSESYVVDSFLSAVEQIEEIFSDKEQRGVI